MRILYSHRIRSRDGQGVHLDAMVAALRAAGHEVRVTGPAGYDKAALGGESRGLARLRRLLPAWAQALAEIGYAVPATWRLHRAAAAFRPDVIYERANLYHVAGRIVARTHGVPLLLEVNAPLAEERAKFGGLGLPRLSAWIERFAWRGAQRVLPVTEVLAGRVAAAGVPAARITVVPNGIDLAEFPEAVATPVRDTLVLGFVGFVRDWHGLDKALHGIAAWRGERALSLVVVGDGPARPGLERLARDLGIADRVHFTGLAAREEIPALVAGFDIALQPAAVPYASPLKVFEYMAAARAIVAPDQANLREVLRDGETALLFDPSEAGGFWGAVARLAQDDGLRARLGTAARAEVVSRDLTWAGNARRVVAIAEAERAALRPDGAPAKLPRRSLA
ncbi:glycosyltransferase family 4 protein [Falsiroseomonas tokyonensis]|uniref:Glycosyltransferase family 4 protein n=1 Tax=Falsiroseomonas tokyonensis TaxID=430521 RepID=A0ABV7BRJ5_9PROT|nr:glycosyltransferase family 4 protein [Falsiroseomonas tokyonensis]MBU8536742.1 glycosyltransferase family 4 protein [Falsiroseomonas tokyonensis]